MACWPVQPMNNTHNVVVLLNFEAEWVSLHFTPEAHYEEVILRQTPSSAPRAFNDHLKENRSAELKMLWKGSLFSLLSFVAVVIIEQQVIISALYCVMTCGLLQGQYGGYQNRCQSASNLLNTTFN